MNQGMVGNAVTEWCHVTGNGISGWVDENYIAFTNVYRIQVSVGCNANVYAARAEVRRVGTVHVGDYIVIHTPSPDGTGFISILWVNQQTGQAMTAYLDGSVA